MTQLIAVVEDNLQTARVLEEDIRFRAKHICLQVWYNALPKLAAKQAVTLLQTLRPNLLVVDSLADFAYCSQVVQTAQKNQVPVVLLTSSPELYASFAHQLGIRLIPKSTPYPILTATLRLMMK